MRIIKGPHSYEELRAIVIDILLQSAPISHGPTNYPNLVNGVAEVLVKRNAEVADEPFRGGTELRMDPVDVELVRDIFWDLFRQGIVILGRDDQNEHWPNFRLSHHAKETLLKRNPYRFHDSISYIKLVHEQAPNITVETEVYLEEAIATYYSDCLLACCVMVGVAAEIEFKRLITTGLNNRTHGHLFTASDCEHRLRQKIAKFEEIVTKLPKGMIGEDFVTHLLGIQSILRVARNKAGHSLANRTPLREQVYVYLQLFVPFAGHVEQLRNKLT